LFRFLCFVFEHKKTVELCRVGRSPAKPQRREEKHWVSEWCLKGFPRTTEEVPRKPCASTEEYFSIGISHPHESEREVKLSFLIRHKEI